MQRIYLDHAATTPAHPRVVEAMLPYFTENFGNPSSIYSYGQEARAAIDEARQKVAAFIGARTEEIVFTSGGTESDNFAIKGTAYASKHKGDHIITSAIEHHAVLESCEFLQKQGWKVTYVRVDRNGLVDPEDVRRAITDKTVLITIMHANNEIGTIQPIAEIGKIARERGIPFHTDAVQTLGHLPLNVDDLKVDMLAASAHKLYGPKGVGALYIRKGTKLMPFMHGGGQEQRRRASTENVPGIVGFGAAVDIAGGEMEGEARRLTALRDRLIDGLLGKIGESSLNGDRKRRLPNNVNISIDYVEGESMLLNLDIQGIAASTGSACTSASLEASHVLLALGLSHERAHGSLRFTFGKQNSEADVDKVLEVLPPVVAKLRAMSPLLRKRS